MSDGSSVLQIRSLLGAEWRGYLLKLRRMRRLASEIDSLEAGLEQWESRFASAQADSRPRLDALDEEEKQLLAERDVLRERIRVLERDVERFSALENNTVERVLYGIAWAVSREGPRTTDAIEQLKASREALSAGNTRMREVLERLADMPAHRNDVAFQTIDAAFGKSHLQDQIARQIATARQLDSELNAKIEAAFLRCPVHLLPPRLEALERLAGISFEQLMEWREAYRRLRLQQFDVAGGEAVPAIDAAVIRSGFDERKFGQRARIPMQGKGTAHKRVRGNNGSHWKKIDVTFSGQAEGRAVAGAARWSPERPAERWNAALAACLRGGAKQEMERRKEDAGVVQGAISELRRVADGASSKAV